jgi:hypothetical protein
MKRVKRASPTLYHAWEKEKEGKSGRLPIAESKGETAKPDTDDSRPPKTWKRKSPEDLRKSKTNSKIQGSQPLRKRHGNRYRTAAMYAKRERIASNMCVMTRLTCLGSRADLGSMFLLVMMGRLCIIWAG